MAAVNVIHAHTSNPLSVFDGFGEGCARIQAVVGPQPAAILVSVPFRVEVAVGRGPGDKGLKQWAVLGSGWWGA